MKDLCSVVCFRSCITSCFVLNLFCVHILQIEVRVCDRAPNTLCAATNGRVIVTVIRNHYPFFRNLPYDRDLDLNFNAGQSVVTVEGADPDPVVRNPFNFAQIVQWRTDD